MNPMKTMVSLCISILCAALLLSCMPVHGEDALYDRLIRLHVVAESDTEADQAKKLAVRDAVLDVMKVPMTESDTYAAAVDALQAALPQIKLAAQIVAGDTPISVTLTTEPYPTRIYEDITLPAGEYLSLRILLGDAEGRNWWCVLFPRLCVNGAAETEEAFIEAGFTPEEYRILRRDSGTKYVIRFRILEWLNSWKYAKQE